ncbi:MAG: ribosome maturation factor RimM [Firmicutes bacterium]|nr:ribosome maturation factor RimM [Bacillota bacterium]
MTGEPEEGAPVAVGRVRRPHGVRGEMWLEPYAADPARYRALRRVFVGGRPYPVAGVRVGREGILLRLAGVDDRTAADALRGLEVCVPAEERAELPAGRYYVDDLVGLRVLGPDGRPLGTAVDVRSLPAQDVLVVRTKQGEAWVPMVRALVREVDVAAGRIVIDPPAGLLPEGEA